MSAVDVKPRLIIGISWLPTGKLSLLAQVTVK